MTLMADAGFDMVFVGIESADLRYTFYAAGVFFALAALIGKLIREDNARPVWHLIRYLMGQRTK